MKLTDHFTQTEMACRCTACNHACKMDTRHMNRLEQLRCHIDTPIKVNSGYRCPRHNAEVGGVPTSFHMRGKATDCVPQKMDLGKFAEIAKLYFEEVIVYPTFVHVANAR